MSERPCYENARSRAHVHCFNPPPHIGRPAVGRSGGTVKAAPYTLTQQPRQKHCKIALNAHSARITYDTTPRPSPLSLLRTRWVAAVAEAESEFRTIHTLLWHLPHLAAFIPKGLPPSLQVIGTICQRSRQSHSEDGARWRGAPALRQETQ